MTRQEMIQIHRKFRKADESHLWPICGDFNVTERAIRHLADFRAMGYSAEEYELALDDEIGEIVNSY